MSQAQSRGPISQGQSPLQLRGKIDLHSSISSITPGTVTAVEGGDAAPELPLLNDGGSCRMVKSIGEALTASRKSGGLSK